MRNARLISAVCALSLTAALTSVPALAAESAAEEAMSAAESIAEEPEIAERPVYEFTDYVTLGEYKGLSVSVAPVSISDEEVDAEIETRIQLSDEGSDTLEEGTVEEGDIANIDYMGKKGNVAFQGGTYQGYDLTIGSGSFIPGFEDALIGAEIGSTVEIPLTFPEEYHNEDLAGKDVVFTVTINYVSRYKELDDELASVLSEGEAEDVDSYRELVRGELNTEAVDAQNADTKQQLVDLAVANCTFEEFPEDLVAYDIQEMTSYYTSMAEMYGMDLADFMTAMYGLSEEQYYQVADMSVRRSLMQEFCLGAIADAEGLADEETLKESYDALAEQVGFEDGHALIAEYGESVVRNAAVSDLAMNFLFENAVIEEIPEETYSMMDSVEDPMEEMIESEIEEAE